MRLQNRLRLLITFLVLMLTAPVLAEKAPADWSGNWESRWRDGGAPLILNQEGAQVTGTYPLHGGRIEARAQGRTL